MIETTKPERYIWKGGKPVFDVLKNLFAPSANGCDNAAISLNQKIAESGIDGLIEQRENVKLRTQTVLGKISEWSFQKKDIAERIDAIRADFYVSIADGNDPDTLTDEVRSLVAEDAKLTEWIGTAEKVAFESERELERIDSSIGRAFGPVMLEQKKIVQQEIDKHAAEITRLYRDHFDSVRKLSAGIKVPGNSGLWVKLHVSVPRELVAPAFMGAR